MPRFLSVLSVLALSGCFSGKVEPATENIEASPPVSDDLKVDASSNAPVVETDYEMESADKAESIAIAHESKAKRSAPSTKSVVKPRPAIAPPAPEMEAFAPVDQVASIAPRRPTRSNMGVPSQMRHTRPAVNTENYTDYGVNGFSLVERDALSTFAVDVDTASYTCLLYTSDAADE